MYLPEDNQDAIDWAIDADTANGGSWTLSAYVDTKQMYALGTRKRKQGSTNVYSW